MNTEIKIERGIPIPSHANKKYPFREMKVGDSFSVACSPNDVRKTQRTITACAYRYKKTHPKTKFTVRSIRGEETGVRCWRIA